MMIDPYAVIREWTVIIEDDNGRYFQVLVHATDSDDARKRVSYLLDKDNARIVGVQ